MLFGGPQDAFDVLFCSFLGQHADHLFFDDVPSVFLIFARLRALLWTYKSSLSVRWCLMRMMEPFLIGLELFSWLWKPPLLRFDGFGGAAFRHLVA